MRIRADDGANLPSIRADCGSFGEVFLAPQDEDGDPGTKLDIESPEECFELLERVAVGLGMFVASQPFWLNPKLDRIELMPARCAPASAVAGALHTRGKASL